MKRTILLTILMCAIGSIIAISDVQAQSNTAPANVATAPGGPGRFGRGQMLPPGPPAPVPPEVAIPHPTAEEIAKLNADLKEYIGKSSDKELLQKWESLLAVQMPRDNSGIRPSRPACAPPRGTTDSSRPPPTAILTFCLRAIPSPIGGSNVAARAVVFNKYFGDVKVANFAVAGDTTQGVLWGLQNGEGQGHKPKAVMLMIGTNNTGGNSGAGNRRRRRGRLFMNCARIFPMRRSCCWPSSLAAPARRSAPREERAGQQDHRQIG